jgi:hypothetical protein
MRGNASEMLGMSRAEIEPGERKRERYIKQDGAGEIDVSISVVNKGRSTSPMQ